jgi:peptidoglycan/LPS O-acetylase OafA/YrhL
VMGLSILFFRDDLERIYVLPTSWALAMVIGASARIWKPHIASVLPSGPIVRGGLAIGALLLILVISLLPDGKASLVSYLIVGPAVALLTIVIVFVWADWEHLPSLLMKPLLHLGTISYGAYLWNYPISVWLGTLPQKWWIPLMSIILTIAAAVISWVTVERPILRIKDRLDGHDRPIIGTRN